MEGKEIRNDMEEIVVEFLRAEGILDDEGSVRCFVNSEMLVRLLIKFGDEMYRDGLAARYEDEDDEFLGRDVN